MTEIKEVYNPLKTRSGLPHLSHEQREFFEKQQKDLIKDLNISLNHHELKQIYGMYTDIEKLILFDLVNPSIHPIHANALMSLDALDRIYDKMGNVESDYQMEKIDKETYEKFKNIIKYNELKIKSDWSLEIKKELKQFMIDNPNIKEDNKKFYQ
jgi:hypothetical protein